LLIFSRRQRRRKTGRRRKVEIRLISSLKMADHWLKVAPPAPPKGNNEMKI
jgi:hypothetical protein